MTLAGCGNKQSAESVSKDAANAKPPEVQTLTVYSAGPDGLAANIQQAFEEKNRHESRNVSRDDRENLISLRGRKKITLWQTLLS